MPHKKSLRKKLYPVWFLLPCGILITIFFILPALLSIGMAFTEWKVNFNPVFVGIDNFKRLFKDPYLVKVLVNTIIYVILGEFCVEFMSIFIAILTQYYVKQKVARYIYRTIWLCMNALPSLVYVVFMNGFLEGTENGVLNSLLLTLGVISEPVSWLGHHAMIIVILSTGFLMGTGGVILLSAAINSIPEDYYKAARIDGASEFGIVRQIVLPLLSWTIMYQVVSGCIGFFSGYMYIMLLTDGGPNRATTTLSLYAYQSAFVSSNFGYGATITIFILIICVALVSVLFKMFNFNEMVRPPRIDD